MGSAARGAVFSGSFPRALAKLAGADHLEFLFCFVLSCFNFVHY